MTKKLTEEEVIKRFEERHGDKYDYSLVEYVNTLTKVKIICPIHGVFEQTPDDHFFHECFKCGRNQGKTLNIRRENFIIKASQVHNGFYTYTSVNYINNNIKIEIICPKHGSFFQSPSKHLSGHGCHICNNHKKRNYKSRKSKLEKISINFSEVEPNLENFVKYGNIIHGNYDYSLSTYIDSKTKITIICKKHGQFFQTFEKHIRRQQGCSLCSKEKLRKQFQFFLEEFLERAKNRHGKDKYDYSLVEYINAHTKIKIICKKHGPFLQEPNSHICGNGCPRCPDNNHSKEADKWLDELGIKEREFIIIAKSGKKYIVDGYKSNTNTIYEYLGSFWHGNPEKYNPNDINKKNGITFGELYKNTINRIEDLEESGFKVIYKWGK